VLLAALNSSTRAAAGLADLEILALFHRLVAGDEQFFGLLQFFPQRFQVFLLVVSIFHDPCSYDALAALKAVTSSATPGPIVEHTVAVFTYLPLAAAGLAFNTA